MSLAAFQNLVQRVRGGDDEAAAELVRRFEPHIRRVVRFRLTDPALRAVMDSTDVVQSVLADFFCRAAAGRFEIETPDRLRRLLAVMVRNKIIAKHRKERIRAGTLGGAADEADLRRVPNGAGPADEADWEDLLAEFRKRLSPEERAIVDRRRAGLAWDAIAGAFGGSADACRMRLRRAYDRVCEELRLED